MLGCRKKYKNIMCMRHSERCFFRFLNKNVRGKDHFDRQGLEHMRTTRFHLMGQWGILEIF